MNTKEIPKISPNFTNIKGQHYDKVREIAYKKGELFKNLGTFVTETRYKSNAWLGSSFNLTNGVYIYQSKSNPYIGYRIYKCYADYGFNGCCDDRLIQQLRERQEKIKLSKFPTGVVTLEGRIIGQEMPYYPDKVTLYTFFEKHPETSPFIIYRAILDIINEMYQNGISYIDNHPNNFMINTTDSTKIDVIDFDETYVKFDDNTEKTRIHLLSNYRIMINKLNKMLGVNSVIGDFQQTSSFQETYNQLDYMSKYLKREKQH